MLFGFQSEGVHVDTSDRNISVMLEGLYQIEVSGNPSAETVMSIQLQLSVNQRISTSETSSISEIGPLVGSLRNITSCNPHQFLNWVIEVQSNLVAGTGQSFDTSELQLFDQIFVRYLCESSSLISIQIYVVYKQTCRSECRSSCGRGLCSRETFRNRSEFNVDLYLVVL